MAAVWVLLLMISIAECRGASLIKKTTTEIAKKADYHIQFDETKLTCKVSRKFVSIAFSAGQLNKTVTGYDPSNAKLRRLLKALSPSYIRIGGSRANFMKFEPRDSGDDQADDRSYEKTEDNKEKIALELPSETSRLESRAIVPQPTVDDIDRLETHKYKRFTLDLPKIPKKKKPKKAPVKPAPVKPPGLKPETQETPVKPDDDDAGPDQEGPDNEGPDNEGPDNEGPESDESNGTPDEMTEKEKKKRRKEKKFKGYREFKLTAERFDSLYHLINGTGNSMLFDINAFTRVPNSRSWDSKNAEQLITYAENMGYSVDWQLGNEPNHYKKFGKKHEQTGEEVGNDYITFKSLVKAKMPNAKIVGPEVTRPKSGGKVEDWLGQFLKTAGDSIDALTWHQYYVDGKKATEDDFVDSNNLDKFVTQSNLMQSIIQKNNFTKPVWVTETGSAWGGGAKDLSDRFAGMFPYVDKLGVAGNHCVHVVARQAFLAGKYAMVNKVNYNPHPEYYAAVLFKRLAANGILKMQSDKNDKNFRVYARCARPSKHTLPGSVFIIVLNLNEGEKRFAFPVYELFKVKQYLFTADSLKSDIVKLNGKPLMMEGDKLPRMRPVNVEQPVKVPGLSIGFYILDLVSLNIC